MEITKVSQLKMFLSARKFLLKNKLSFNMKRKKNKLEKSMKSVEKLKLLRSKLLNFRTKMVPLTKMMTI
jgi:hypothetical protein